MLKKLKYHLENRCIRRAGNVQLHQQLYHRALPLSLNLYLYPFSNIWWSRYHTCNNIFTDLYKYLTYTYTLSGQESNGSKTRIAKFSLNLWIICSKDPVLLFIQVFAIHLIVKFIKKIVMNHKRKDKYKKKVRLSMKTCTMLLSTWLEYFFLLLYFPFHY